MPYKIKRDIVDRWEGNPIIKLDNLSFTTNNIFCAGAVKKDGEYILLVTMEDPRGKTSIYLARSEDGYYFDVDEEPFLLPNPEERYRIYEEVGAREARVTYMEGRYYIIYLGVGHHGSLLYLAVTDNFNEVKRLGVISEPETKAGALFPEKINGP